MKNQLYLYDCNVAGLPKPEAKEGGDYRFRRRELLRCTTERAVWGNRHATLNAALDPLKNKSKKPTRKITLTADQAETILRALRDYQALDVHFTKANIHAKGLLAVIDEAGALYREGKRSAAAKKIAWTTGKRGQAISHADIIVNYLFLIGAPEPYRKTKEQAVKFLRKLFGLQSEAAVL
ncbi:MAG: hypothetical protein NTZ24_14560, partial [Deltaproteobacteria bacterium]|nr:hypothetical protein [Deltaproteobacteria bacterium]